MSTAPDSRGVPPVYALFYSDSPQIQRLVHHNNPPSIAEEECVRHELGVLQMRLRCIEAMGQQLTMERQHVQFAMQRRARLLSVMWRLPAEVLSEIFKAGLSSRYSPFDRLAYPAVVSKVCSRWRHVAIFTPSLWSNIHLEVKYKDGCSEPLPAPSPERNDAIMHAVETWARRSKYLGVTIVFDAGLIDECPVVISYLNAVLAVSSYLRALKVSLLASDAFSHLLSGLSNSCLANLHTLAFCYVDDGKTTPFTIDAPHLRSLTSDYDIEHRHSLSSTAFPWAQLTSLTMIIKDSYRGESEPKLEAIRLAAGTLEEFTLGLYAGGWDEYDTTDFEHIEHIVFPRLRLFRHNQTCGPLLYMFSMPVLQELYLESKETVWDQLTEFAHRCQDKLHRLTIDLWNTESFGRDDMAEFLKAVCNVEKLVLRGTSDEPSNTATVLDLLVCPDEDEEEEEEDVNLLLPRLSRLEVYNCGSCDSLVQALIDMITTRWDKFPLGMKGLEELTIYEDLADDEDLSREIEVWKGLGTRVLISREGLTTADDW